MGNQNDTRLNEDVQNLTGSKVTNFTGNKLTDFTGLALDFSSWPVSGFILQKGSQEAPKELQNPKTKESRN